MSTAKPPPAPATLRTEPAPAPSAPSAAPPATPKRPPPTEIPWPDAFEPRPNYRTPEPRKWSWLLVIPAGIVAAVAVSFIDTRGLRLWIDANVLHRAADSGAATSLLPAPFRAADPTAAGGEAPETVNPYPAIPTSPVPVPPGTEVSPPPNEPVAAPTPAVVHVMIEYRRNIPGAEGEARRIAALLHSFGGSIELRPNDTSTRDPTIYYYNPGDKGAATALATALANEAVHWIVKPGTAKNPPGTLDVWLP